MTVTIFMTFKSQNLTLIFRFQWWRKAWYVVAILSKLFSWLWLFSLTFCLVSHLYIGSVFFFSFLERDAFDALFDNAPEKLNVVKKVLYMQFNFGEIMAALKVPVRYNKVHEAIAMHRFGSVKAHLDLSWKLLFVPCDVWLSCMYSMFREYPVCTYNNKNNNNKFYWKLANN